MRVAYFDRFMIAMPQEAVNDMSGPGPADDAVRYWEPKIAREPGVTPEALRAELREYGAWDAEQLADDNANWERILWIAAGNIRERGE